MAFYEPDNGGYGKRMLWIGRRTGNQLIELQLVFRVINN
jgi:hypothetical protein